MGEGNLNLKRLPRCYQLWTIRKTRENLAEQNNEDREIEEEQNLMKISMKELEEELSRIKTGKACGADNIESEMVKYLENEENS
ncbi:hypothetical protein ILUMI_21816 [Ignelater luminosus]|uniref:Uncharacterized protein n=1 Tax=Ignelater luminosus TaxID=2038154 RepID=A0A8K0G134_IGNLU|nr:hypothetical protein ILUMI_21816 [Ignelater luminosus]